jgi:hypothetical protein
MKSLRNNLNHFVVGSKAKAGWVTYAKYTDGQSGPKGTRFDARLDHKFSPRPLSDYEFLYGKELLFFVRLNNK